MRGGDEQREEEVAEGTNGLDAANQAEKNASDAGAPAVGCEPMLKTSFEDGGTVEAEVNEDGDGEEHADAEEGGAGFSGGFEGGRDFAGVGLAASGKDNQTGGGKGGGGCGVEEAFEGVDTKNVGEGNLTFAREQEGTDGFTGAA